MASVAERVQHFSSLLEGARRAMTPNNFLSRSPSRSGGSPAAQQERDEDSGLASAADDGGGCMCRHSDHLAALQQQYDLQEQEVQVLRSQVQRLCNMYADLSSGEQPGRDPGKCTQPELCEAELLQLRAQLQQMLTVAEQQQSLLGAATAAKTDLDHRMSALKVLLAQVVHDNMALTQGLGLCEEALVLAATRLAAGPGDASAGDGSAPAGLQQQQQRPAKQQSSQPTDRGSLQQQQLLDRLQQQLEQQSDELSEAAAQAHALSQALALKEDSEAHLKRYATQLEQQLASAQQQVAAAATARSAEGSSHNNSRCSTPAHVATPCAACSPAPSSLPHEQQQEQQQREQQQREEMESSPVRMPSLQQQLAGMLSSASPGPGPAVTGDASAAATSSPRMGELINPFAKARSFMAQREAEQLVRCKEELHQKEKQLREVAARASKADDELHGLQTVVTARSAACARLEAELRQAERQLRQAQAAAAADSSALKQQLAAAGESVQALQQQLVAAHGREQQLGQELAAVSNKLEQVLKVVVQDAAALAKHDPSAAPADGTSVPRHSWAAIGLAEPDGTAARAVLASSSAAALAILGSSSSRAAVARTSSSGDHNPHRTLLGALMGRRHSERSEAAGNLQPEREMKSSSSARSSSEWPPSAVQLGQPGALSDGSWRPAADVDPAIGHMEQLPAARQEEAGVSANAGWQVSPADSHLQKRLNAVRNLLQRLQESDA